MQSLSADWILAGIAALSACIALVSLIVSRRSQREAIDQQRDLGLKQLEENRRQFAESTAILREQLRLQFLELQFTHGDEIAPGTAALAPLTDETPPAEVEFPAQPVTVMLPEESPYVVGPPILESSRFAGRVAQTADFYGYLLGGQLQSVSLLGARRSGKTSFLFHVSSAPILETHAGPTAARLIAVYIDLQAAGPAPQAFFSRTARLTALALRRRSGSDLPEAAAARADYGRFLRLLDAATRAGWQYLFLLDEFERVTRNPAFTFDFFDNLRALTQDYAPNVALVTTSMRPLSTLTSGEPQDRVSPLFNVFYPTPLYLGAMIAEEARLLVAGPAERAGLPFTPEDVGFVCDLAGRLPFGLQAAADALYRARLRGAAGEAGRAAARQVFAEGMRPHFEHHWRYCTDAERAALARLAAGQASPPADARALSELARYGFVEEAPGGGYRVLGSAFAEWIRVTGSAAR
jgi:hypothetical protein